MNQTVLPAGACPACGARWTWTGQFWLISDEHGRAAIRVTPTALGDDGAPLPLSRCPECRALLAAGPARVEEVKG